MVHEQSYLGTISGGGCGHGSALMVGTATTAATDEAPPRHAVACHYEAVHAAQLYRHRNTRAANYSQTVSPTSTPGLKMEVNQGSLDPSTWKIATSATSLQQNDHHSHNVPHHSPMKPPPTIKPLASDSSIIDIPDLSTLNLRCAGYFHPRNSRILIPCVNSTGFCSTRLLVNNTSILSARVPPSYIGQLHFNCKI